MTKSLRLSNPHMLMAVFSIAAVSVAAYGTFSLPQADKAGDSPAMNYDTLRTVSVLVFLPLVLIWSAWMAFQLVRNWDPADFGYTIVAAMQLKRVKILRAYDQKTMHKMFLSRDKGNFLETNHAQDAWKPILSVESAGGKEWEGLRNALLKVFKQINWQARLKPIMDKILSEAETSLDCRTLQRQIARILFELVTDSPLPEKDIEKLLEGVDSWTVSLSGKGVGEYEKKEYVLEYMRQAVDNMPGKPLDKDDLFVMSAIMQPLFVSPIINVPDIFAVAEEQLKALDSDTTKQVLSGGAVCEAFLKECLRCGHPFPIIERKVPGGCLGSHQLVCRYDLMCANHTDFDLWRWCNQEDAASPSSSKLCPYALMIFGAGPRRCQGSHLALDLMKALLMHYGKNPDEFKPTQGHNISGRTNDDKGSIEQELHKISVIFKTMYKTSVICAPLRLIYGAHRVGH